MQTFSIGMGTSPDLVAAKQVALHCGTEHHEVTFTEQDVANALDKVLRCVETCDITTVRASVGAISYIYIFIIKLFILCCFFRS